MTLQPLETSIVHDKLEQKQIWWQYYYQLYHYQLPPGRKPTVFGPYLLLQTLGEGEFGKVKFGVEVKTGQEVAIKLIRKDSIDSASRMTKVEREITVLRKLRHPFIVDLHDVIETEKYIGIILQCATGGELFDYILAHRYLKEKDASRLFAQLISGVHYMHQKQIVHRDLKLENLLLDRHRNVLITDFGFANQFSSSIDDLMATSCGSPCYAAPELVMNQGLYVGTAVDIWSCGVILFAMLCGYLPFDDDPENPESDNINLLYKYILNTPLIFPDYISQEACDLMRLMLVPDPIKRCDMETIMDHPWLENHRHLFKSLDTQVSETSIADNPQTTPLENIPQQNDEVEESTENLSNQVGQVGQEEKQEDQEDQEDQEQEATTENDGENEEVTYQVEPAELPSSTSQLKDDHTDISIEDPVETIPVNENETSQENVPDMNTLPLEEPVETTIEIKNNHDQHTTQELKSVTTTMDDDNNANSDQDDDVSILESVQFNNTSSINDAITEPDTPKPSVRVDNKRSSAESKHSDHFLSGHIDTPPPRSTKHMSLEGSILQAKFLSSVQRKDSKQKKQMTPPPSPRRKTLSLLVNSIDHKFTKSQRTPMMPSVSEHTSLSEKEKRSTGKKFIDWFKKTPLSTIHRSTLIDVLHKEPVIQEKLRTHHGAVDQDALTSRSPSIVLLEIKQTLNEMGLDFKKDGDYKLRCTRHKKTFRKLLRRPNGIYGDPTVDPGEEVRFSVEICRIKNLPGLYIVDMRRLRGNVWAYKFLYRSLLDTLHLGYTHY